MTVATTDRVKLESFVASRFILGTAEDLLSLPYITKLASIVQAFFKIDTLPRFYSYRVFADLNYFLS